MRASDRPSTLVPPPPPTPSRLRSPPICSCSPSLRICTHANDVIPLAIASPLIIRVKSDSIKLTGWRSRSQQACAHAHRHESRARPRRSASIKQSAMTSLLEPKPRILVPHMQPLFARAILSFLPYSLSLVGRGLSRASRASRVATPRVRAREDRGHAATDDGGRRMAAHSHARERP